MGQRFGRYLRQLLRQRNGRLGRRIEGQGQRNAIELRVHRVDDALIAVPQLHRRHAGQAVDVPPPGVVANPYALALDQHQRVVHKGFHLIEVDNQVVQARVGLCD